MYSYKFLQLEESSCTFCLDVEMSRKCCPRDIVVVKPGCEPKYLLWMRITHLAGTASYPTKFGDAELKLLKILFSVPHYKNVSVVCVVTNIIAVGHIYQLLILSNSGSKYSTLSQLYIKCIGSFELYFM